MKAEVSVCHNGETSPTVSDSEQLCEEYLEKIKEKSDDIKKFIAHVGLYVGLILFTAFGALVHNTSELNNDVESDGKIFISNDLIIRGKDLLWG